MLLYRNQCALITILMIFSFHSHAELAINSPAPNFDLLDQDNNQQMLSDFSGKWLYTLINQRYRDIACYKRHLAEAIYARPRVSRALEKCQCEREGGKTIAVRTGRVTFRRVIRPNQGAADHSAIQSGISSPGMGFATK